VDLSETRAWTPSDKVWSGRNLDISLAVRFFRLNERLNLNERVDTDDRQRRLVVQVCSLDQLIT